MTTRTLTPREMTLAQIEAMQRRDWPADATVCDRCGGNGEIVNGYPDGMPLADRCPRCFGTGYTTTDTTRVHGS